MEIFFAVTGLVLGFTMGLILGFAFDFKIRKSLYDRIAELESEDTE